MRNLTVAMLAVTASIVIACSDDSPTNPFGTASNMEIAPAQSPLVPKAPTGLVAAANFMNISLTWTDNSSDEDGFLLETLQSPSYDWGPPGGYPANTTGAFARSNSSADQYIQFRVTAYNKYGKSAPSNVATAWVLNPPTNVAVTLVDVHTVDITWTNRSRWASGVEILRGPTIKGPFTVIANDQRGSSYRDAGLALGTYWYLVHFHKDSSVSEPWYGHVSTSTSPPNAQIGFVAQPTSSSYILGSWERSQTNETGYRVEQSVDGGVTWTTNQTLPGWSSGTYGTPAIAEQRLCLRVIAFNDYGDSPPSNVACTTPPAAPTDLTGEFVNGGVTLAWRDNSSVEDGYSIYRSTHTIDCSMWGCWQGEFDVFELIAQVPGNVTTFRDTLSTAPNGYAMYSVQPVKDGGVGDGSDVLYLDFASALSPEPGAFMLNKSNVRRRVMVAPRPHLPTPQGVRNDHPLRGRL